MARAPDRPGTARAPATEGTAHRRAPFRLTRDTTAPPDPPRLESQPSAETGANGDARPTHVAWELRRGIPETSSLLWTAGRLCLVRDGGLLTCLEAATGRELFRERIGPPGQYIASPVTVGDRLVVASVQGVVTVMQVGDTLTVLAWNELDEGIYATPAVAGDRLYLRTVKRLFAFGP